MPRKLNELGFVGRGRSRNRPRNDPTLYGGPYPFIQTADIMTSELRITKYSQTYSEKGLAQSRLWNENTLCMTIAGENTAETAILSFKACFPDSVVGFVADPDEADVRFIKYYLDTIKQQLKNVSKGATQDNLSLDKLLSFDILTPPADTQRKIASILSTYDDLIENNTRRIAILEEMAQSLYREWFVHFRFPGHAKNRMVESALGRIPEGWEVVKLGDICFITMGQSPSSQFYNESGDGLPFHQGVADFGDHFPVDRIYCTVANRVAEAGDVLFSVRAPVGRINLAIKKIVIGRGLSAIRSKAGNQSFVFQQLKELFQEEDMIGNGAIFKSVTKEDVYGIKMLQPPQTIISLFEQNVKPIFSNVEVLTTKNSNLCKTRDLLLPKLISGEVDLERLEVDTKAVKA
ncbi:MAG TPA: restriction endonuclease subunit S [Ktedonobacteraceae bacterium]|nr:restriction endonuclease subunit S [Ktedonobacteraceae bacterium]